MTVEPRFRMISRAKILWARNSLFEIVLLALRFHLMTYVFFMYPRGASKAVSMTYMLGIRQRILKRILVFLYLCVRILRPH